VIDGADQEWKQGDREQQARLRGERIRAELMARLRPEEGQTAADLLAYMPPGVSLAEVTFQLERLAEEGEAVSENGGSYQLE